MSNVHVRSIRQIYSDTYFSMNFYENKQWNMCVISIIANAIEINEWKKKQLKWKNQNKKKTNEESKKPRMICGSLKHFRHWTEKIKWEQVCSMSFHRTCSICVVFTFTSYNKIAAYKWHGVDSVNLTRDSNNNKNAFTFSNCVNWIWRMWMNEHECIWCVQKRFNLFEISSWIVHKLTLPWQRRGNKVCK